jgi:hypothetical protein
MITSKTRLDAEAKELLDAEAKELLDAEAKELLDAEAKELLDKEAKKLANILIEPVRSENEHMEYASYVAKTIIGYPHEEQNEILARIFDNVLSYRIHELDAARSQTSAIVESLEGLKRINADHPNNL